MGGIAEGDPRDDTEATGMKRPRRTDWRSRVLGMLAGRLSGRRLRLDAATLRRWDYVMSAQRLGLRFTERMRDRWRRRWIRRGH